MRISRLISVMVVGLFSLGVFSLAFAKPILDFKHESVFSSSFCQKHGCRFVVRSGDHTDGIDLDQYSYRLQNDLYFVAARYAPDSRFRYDAVSAVSLQARATPSNLKNLEAFLPTFINETAFGFSFPFKYDFKRKCARAAQASYDGGGLFEVIVLPRAKNLKSSVRQTLTIACIAQPFDMLSITLYWGGFEDRIDHTFGLTCTNQFRQVQVTCPWAYPSTVPRRIF